jgi:endoglucanase
MKCVSGCARKGRALFWVCVVLCLATCARASELVELLPLTDQIILLHFNDGHVIHHQRGQSRSDEKVLTNPLDTAAASSTQTYTITSHEDARYLQSQHPVQVGRKSKGTDFAWFIDKWENGHAVNTRPDHTKEHWVYLFLPQAMKRGKTYTVETGTLASNGQQWKLLFDEASSRSEAVHVNLLGYVPRAPQKFGYVYHWLGDKGGLDLKTYEGRAFHLLDRNGGKSLFQGKLHFRMSSTKQETFHKSDSPPDGNFLKADVYECDFSSFKQSGKYVLSVEGIGCSFPFAIDADIYREPFRIMARGLCHNRSGIALEKPFTEFTRPAPHNPKLTPGFASKLIYTSVRFTEWGSEGGDAKELLAHSKGPIQSAGWYQDAGDWDSYYTHLRVAQELLLAYEMAPKNFTDGELNIPESKNGVPDILDEAAWLPRFCYRLRHELLDKHYGTGGLGLRIAGDAFGEDEKSLQDGRKVGQGSWEDVNRTWAASGEDPWSTYRYAGAAAHLAFCLEIAHVKDPEGVDWAKEAAEAYVWAQKNTRPGDEQKGPALREPRAYAAAALFRITGDKAYERQFAADTADITASTALWDDRQYGPVVYALSGGKGQPELALQQRIRSAVLATADILALEVPAKRALRWGGNWYMPMLVGQQTTPWMLQAAAGYVLTRDKDPAKAQQYLAALYTTCDYFLGCNALNMTWATGLGPRHPRHVFHMDDWYNGTGEFHPGIIPYGPWRKEKEQGQGPWDVAWPHKTVYPPIDAWPGNERWFDNRCSPMNSEFTIHQNSAPAAALFGFLCNEKK